MEELWPYIQRHNVLLQWEHHITLARTIRTGYEHNVVRTLRAYSPSPHIPLTEHELFAGTILGRAGGASHKRLKELTKAMRERFEEVLEFIIGRIVKGDYDGEENDRDAEALPRAIACLKIGLDEEGSDGGRGIGMLKSWRYVAVAIVLREMKRWGVAGAVGVLPRA